MPNPNQARSTRLKQALQWARAGQFSGARRHALATLRRGASDRDKARTAHLLAEIATLALNAHEPLEAERCLRAAVRIVPRFADLRYRLAAVLAGADRLDESRIELKSALEINPDYIAARVDLALLDARMGQLGEALEALRRLEERRRPTRPESFHEGLGRLGRADWEEAAALLRSAYRLSESPLESELAQLTRRMRAGELKAALALVRKLVDRHPSYPDLQFLLGRVELAQGFADDAVASLCRSLELNPNFHAARIELARALESLGLLALAQDQVAAVLQSEPTHPAARRMRDRWARRRVTGQAHMPLDPGGTSDEIGRGTSRTR